MSEQKSTSRRLRTRIGSDDARRWVRALKLGNPLAKAVLAAVANYMNEDGTAYPGIETLAQDTDIAENTIVARLRWCERIGAIEIVRCWVDENGVRNTERRGRVTSNLIRFRFEVDPEDIASSAAGAAKKRPLSGAAAAKRRTEAAGELPLNSPPRGEGLNRGLPLSSSSVAPHAVSPKGRTGIAAAEADARARDPVISEAAFNLASDLAVIAGHGHDPPDWPPSWCGAPMRVQGWLNEGWTAPLIEIGARKAASRKRPGTIKTVEFFEGAIADEIARQARPLPKGETDVETAWSDRRSRQSAGSGFAAIALARARTAGRT